MKKVSLLVAISCFALSLMAQDENYDLHDFNLVPNPSFEEMDSKLKEGGGVYIAYPWNSVTMNPVDLYSAESKLDDFSVPTNKYGEEKAKTGNNYAGVSFFGYRGRIPRTYLGTELDKSLEEGKQYCLKFHISMSDRSKYAVNNIGMYISDKTVEEMSDANIYLEPQIISATNRVYNKQFSWEEVCGTYTAKGGEKYIVIGNFAKDEDTEQETVKISREIGGRQTNDAYYYIDDVTVIPVEKLGPKDCACSQIAGGQMKVEYKKFGTKIEDKIKAEKVTFVNSDGSKAGEEKPKKEEAEKTATGDDGTVYKKFDSSTNAEAKVEEKVVEKKKEYSPADVVINYELKQYKVPEGEAEKINKLIEYLKANSDKTIQLVGHSDEAEAEVKLIDKRRVLLLRKKLVDSGVPGEQVKFITKGTAALDAKYDGSKNTSVTITVL